MFELFDVYHIGALSATLMAAAALAVLGRHRSPTASRRYIELPLAVAILVNELIWHAYQAHRGNWDVTSSLPLHLCDAAIFVSVAALLFRSQISYELAYFWGLGGSIQALLTPNISAAFPHYEFFRYFFSHSGIIFAVAYLTFGRRMRPRPRSVPRTIAVTVAYTTVVGGVNHLISANYMFICDKPKTASLMDFMGPWPWYILPLVGTGIAVMLLLYLPYYVLERTRRRAATP